ncbi:membrane protein required for colicin V production [Marininema mesophilum]|uniref:Membrane protein required for colicin V production n=1 Tax=Marininema mesophilum TaxID=1048340 RepID=A0A1H3CMN0_9BACL|nr:CvpA family protein [Marininema mesophilum]SDX55280.1 membrane protein required for colicin V production [Marininema mesophilum]
MGGLDWVIILLVLGGVIQGYRKGLIKEAASLIGVLLAIFIAWKFSGDLAPSLSKMVPLPESWTTGAAGLLPLDKIIYSTLAFILLFLITKFAISLIASFLTQMTRLPILSQVNGVGGALLGMLKAFLIMLVIVNLLHLAPWENGRKAVQESALGQAILDATPSLKDSWQKDSAKT